MNLRANLFGWDTILMIAYMTAFTQAAQAGGSTVKQRSEISKEHRWATEEIFASADDWEKSLSDVQQRVAALAKRANHGKARGR